MFAAMEEDSCGCRKGYGIGYSGIGVYPYTLTLYPSPAVPHTQAPVFTSWFAANKEWLQPYAAFCFLHDLFGSAEHWNWGSLSHPTFKVPSPDL